MRPSKIICWYNSNTVFVLIPSTILLVLTSVLIFKTSIELVIFGNFVPYSALVTSFSSNPITSPIFFFSNQVDNY